MCTFKHWADSSRYLDQALCWSKYFPFSCRKHFDLKKKNISNIQGESKNSVIWDAWCRIAPFLCNFPVWCFFNFFLICKFFFVTLMAKKNIRESFFLSKSKVQKSTNVYINYVFQTSMQALNYIKRWVVCIIGSWYVKSFEFALKKNISVPLRDHFCKNIKNWELYLKKYGIRT